jgi:hypothetical protein
MMYTKRLTESDVKFGFVYIGSEFVKEIPKGTFTLVAGEESYTVQLDDYKRLKGLGKGFFEKYALKEGDLVSFVKISSDKISLNFEGEGASMRETTFKPYIGASRVAAILNVGSFDERRNPHVVTLYRDEPFWGLRERDRRFWDRLEVGSRVLIYGEFQGVRGIFLSGNITGKRYTTEPVREWLKNPSGYPCHLYLDLPRIKLDDVEPISLDELSEMDVPFFKDKPTKLISIIFFDESTVGKFDELWRIFHERNEIRPPQPVQVVVRDELGDWLPPRFYELKEGRLTSTEFQKRVNEIFRILGFKVIEFPFGPYPDAVVHLPEPHKSVNPFWIVVDSKNIPGYNLPEADKRAMEAYINGQRLEALNRGLEPSKCYFIFVAPSFERAAEEKLHSIRSDAKAIGGLLSVEALLHLAFIKLKHGNEARIDKLPDLIEGTEITKDKINDVLASAY